MSTQPDFKGNATVDGVDYWLDGWVQERKDGSGRKFFKLKFKVLQAEVQGEGHAAHGERHAAAADHGARDHRRRDPGVLAFQEN